MCDCYAHGIYSRENGQWCVFIDFENNSHTTIRKKRKVLVGAMNFGIDPVNGRAVSNAGELPEGLDIIIEALFEAHFTDRSSLVEWVRRNYAKNNDKENWQDRLPLLFSVKGQKEFWGRRGLAEQSKDFARRSKFYAEQSKFFAKRSKFYAEQSEDYAERSKVYAEWSKDYAKQSKYDAEQSEFYAERSKDYAELAPSALDTDPPTDKTFLSRWCEMFMEHPNDYWAGKPKTSEKELPAYVLHKSQAALLQSN